MSFDEISLVIPCLEMAWDYGYTNLAAEQVARPRVYKTHLWHRDVPKGARYIYVVRGLPAAAMHRMACEDMCMSTCVPALVHKQLPAPPTPHAHLSTHVPTVVVCCRPIGRWPLLLLFPARLVLQRGRGQHGPIPV
jgi:hypothetical protein